MFNFFLPPCYLICMNLLSSFVFILNFVVLQIIKKEIKMNKYISQISDKTNLIFLKPSVAQSILITFCKM